VSRRVRPQRHDAAEIKLGFWVRGGVRGVVMAVLFAGYVLLTSWRPPSMPVLLLLRVEQIGASQLLEPP
jgi:hypothetical protein